MLYFYRFLFLLPLFLEHPVVIKRESSNNGSCSPVWHCSLDCCFFLNIVIFFMSVQCLRQLDMAGSRQSKHMAIPRWRATGRESMSLESLGSWVIIMMSLLLLLLTYVLFWLYRIIVLYPSYQVLEISSFEYREIWICYLFCYESTDYLLGSYSSFVLFISLVDSVKFISAFFLFRLKQCISAWYSRNCLLFSLFKIFLDFMLFIMMVSVLMFLV